MALPLDTEVAIKMGGDLRLRPSLRHAMRLEAREGSFAKLFADLSEGSLTAALFILGPFDSSHVPGQLGFKILDAGIQRICNQLQTFVFLCSGIDPDEKSESKGGSVSFHEYLTQLYRYGTGWLGWTPQQTLDATVAEIKEAYLGRVEMLKAIFGTSESKKPDPADLGAKFNMLFKLHGSKPDHSKAKGKK